MNETIVAETSFQPAPPTWTPVDPGRDGPFAPARRATREALNVDPDVTVLATGHQAAIWHPGILAKDLAISSLATRRRTHGSPTQAIHFIADHDANDGGLISYPTAGPAHGRWRMLPGSDGKATGDRPAASPTPPPTDALRIGGVADGLAAIHAAVMAHTDAENLAWQLGRATEALEGPFAPDVPRRSMAGLLRMPIGHDLIERMLEDPEACIEAHDAALEAERRSRAGSTGRLPRPVARPLRRGSTEELPLWRATSEGRRPVFRGETLDPETCRPRALLATALARLGGCDLFVHGLGGGIYDPAMEDWLRRWLGPGAVAELAPAPLATATLRLPIEVDEPSDGLDATPEALHRLRSDPDLGREGVSQRKMLLDAIDRAPRGSDARRAAFQVLRAEIDIARERGRTVIDGYRERLAAQQETRRRHEVASDRTWAFPLHDTAAIRALALQVDASFGPRDPAGAQPSPNGRGR